MKKQIIINIYIFLQFLAIVFYYFTFKAIIFYFTDYGSISTLLILILLSTTFQFFSIFLRKKFPNETKNAQNVMDGKNKKINKIINYIGWSILGLLVFGIAIFAFWIL